ncbi:DNRLRE domain-containing protein [Haloechinothrix sp. LS1_15]|uniref:DNRLRE domain-containing protein n=1 Tax=Haloechinothrix sp. LS1_15 TaxID=2652248 RepID=UPI0029478745|nr:DNRLRE domain-containing protein [Haloechinothrix sp. LS1_15]MDV6013388.1 DNRLRE domain-containing protein [Haloechinothrix sp. LS1_15]
MLLRQRVSPARWKIIAPGAVAILAVAVAMGYGSTAIADEPENGDEQAERGAAEPGEMNGAAVIKDGWWWAVNETPEDETGFVPQEPPPSNVPEGAIPVAAAAGDPEKISAIEFMLDAQPGAEVHSAVIALRESDESGANINEEDAAILACQITEEFWADGEAAAWETRPEYDCEEGAAEGVRDGDGTWTFDISAMAATWVDEGSPNPQSFALVENVDSPESFQVSFEGVAMDGVGIDVEATGVEREQIGEDEADGVADAVGDGPSGEGAPDGADMPDGAGEQPAGADAAAGDDAPSGAEAPEAAPGEEEAEADAAAGPVRPALYEGIPWPAWLLVPLALGVGYLLMLALGPRGEQVVSGRKGHGVSRALERWTRGGGSATGGA